MSETTPGPWMIDPDAPQWPSVSITAMQGPIKVCPAQVYSLDDAYLVAAAPELVRALGGLKNATKGLGIEEHAIRELIGNANWNVIQHWIGEAEAALAKARGEPS